MGNGRFECRVKKFACDLIGNGKISRMSEVCLKKL